MAPNTAVLTWPEHYPPYEQCVDARIPQHFDRSGTVSSYRVPGDARYDTFRANVEQAAALFEAKGVHGYLSISSAIPEADTLLGTSGDINNYPIFFAVELQKDNVKLWRLVDSELRAMIARWYAQTNEYQDPPIRYFIQPCCWPDSGGELYD